VRELRRWITQTRRRRRLLGDGVSIDNVYTRRIAEIIIHTAGRSGQTLDDRDMGSTFTAD